MLFCSSFLLAKHVVEISYSYAEARALYEKASQAILSIDVEIFHVLSEFANLQSAILKIDRGIYTGYAQLMSASAEELKAKTESILRLLNDKNQDSSHPCYSVLQKNLLAKVKEDKIYANAIIVVAQLYLDRWKTCEDLDVKLASVFRETQNLEADVALKYYTMGVFEMKISFLIDNDYLLQDPEGLSLSGLRHLQSLGTPFALDENIIIENSDEKYQYLAEYTEAKFEKIGTDIVHLLKDSPDVALLADTDGNFKLFFVLILAAASTFLLVNDNYIRDRKG